MYFYFKSIKICLFEIEYWKCNGLVMSGDYGFNILDKRLINFCVFIIGVMVRWWYRNFIDIVVRIMMCKYLVLEIERVNLRFWLVLIFYDRCKFFYDVFIFLFFIIIFNLVIVFR